MNKEQASAEELKQFRLLFNNSLIESIKIFHNASIKMKSAKFAEKIFKLIQRKTNKLNDKDYFNFISSFKLVNDIFDNMIDKYNSEFTDKDIINDIFEKIVGEQNDTKEIVDTVVNNQPIMKTIVAVRDSDGFINTHDISDSKDIGIKLSKLFGSVGTYQSNLDENIKDIEWVYNTPLSLTITANRSIFLNKEFTKYITGLQKMCYGVPTDNLTTISFSMGNKDNQFIIRPIMGPIPQKIFDAKIKFNNNTIICSEIEDIDDKFKIINLIGMEEGKYLFYPKIINGSIIPIFFGIKFDEDDPEPFKDNPEFKIFYNEISSLN